MVVRRSRRKAFGVCVVHHVRVGDVRASAGFVGDVDAATSSHVVGDAVAVAAQTAEFSAELAGQLDGGDRAEAGGAEAHLDATERRAEHSEALFPEHDEPVTRTRVR